MLIVTTKEQTSIFDNNILIYTDSFENFKQDCESLNLTILNDFDVAYYKNELNNHVILSNNQQKMPEQLVEFCKKLFDYKNDLIKLKAERDKPPHLTLDEKKEEAKQKINLLCFSARLKVSGTTDTNKTASWAVYKDIATRYKAGQITQIEKECLEQEIVLRKISGETLEIFVEKVLKNAEFFLRATTLIMGAEKRAALDLEMAQNDQDIENVILNLTTTLNKL